MKISEFHVPSPKEPTLQETLDHELQNFEKPKKKPVEISIKEDTSDSDKLLAEFKNFGKAFTVESVIKEMYTINPDIFDKDFVLVHDTALYINNVLNEKVYTKAESDMLIETIISEDGRIVKGSNTTDDVGLDEIKIQAKKMGFEVTRDGIPALLDTHGKSYKPTVVESKLTEARHGSVILVDFQPAYSPDYQGADNDGFGYNEAIESAIEYINAKSPSVTCFFNGEEVGIEDTAQEVAQHYAEMGTDEHLIHDFNFKEKTYAFLRNWMENGFAIDNGVIIKVIRYMVMNHITDSREIDQEVFMELVGDEFQEGMMDDNIYIPDVSIAELKSLSGSLLGGGGRHECLEEMQLFMNAFNIKYKLVDRWIYG